MRDGPSPSGDPTHMGLCRSHSARRRIWRDSPSLTSAGLATVRPPVGLLRKPQKNIFLPIVSVFFLVCGVGIYSSYIANMFALPALIKIGLPKLGASVLVVLPGNPPKDVGTDLIADATCWTPRPSLRAIVRSSPLSLRSSFQALSRAASPSSSCSAPITPTGGSTRPGSSGDPS